ncbi:hypothetical protein TPY_0549 [Sulfobacillus acidophilus TPY]|uniref:Uncharacterized protein n=1 Tax=Sulfobacillus acidophilus (strain ATCC 700253 / DSM 10332 / NAL) TaxID=679936 RepID=G8U1Q7_SULAD|nr:hypothetical protein TPY_0549 [Sulfobacillus acidophilus TPY]AEW06985.1 hypothetical protein Sulac_3552 [Sulfobacillus acidophilus DSM 10332]
MRDSLWLTFTEALVAGQVATARTAGVSLAAALARAGHPGLAHRVMTVLDTVDPPQPTGGPVVRGSPPPSWRWAPVLRLFLAGPQDTDAVRALTAVGYEIVPAVDAVDADAADALRVNLCRLVQQATGVALLPGWQHESEARLEAVVARRLGLAVHPVATWLACSPGR